MALLKNTTITGTGTLTLPSIATATRFSTTPTIIRWTNTGTQAVSVLTGTTPTLTSTSWTCPTDVTRIEVLVVAGGGSGAGGNGGGAGGGGAGGLIYRTDYPVTPGATYAVAVGAGGASSNGAKAGNDGGNSLFGPSANLVTNGDFTSNVSGWTDPASGAEGSFTWSSNNGGTAILASTNLADPPPCVYQAITCVVGRTYMVTANRVGGTASAVVNIVTSVTTGGGSGGFGNILYFPTTTQVGPATGTFTATQTSYFIFLRMNENTNGTNVIFDSVGVYDLTSNLTAIGGGGGGCNILPGRPGGSGGGAGEYALPNPIGNGGAAFQGQGNKGGDCYSTGGSPGGGGAGSPGGHVYSSALGGTGGAGLYFSISGTSTAYAGGGGGSVNSGPGGAGGSSIGGNGGAGSGGSGTVTAGANNTGSGGGGIYIGASGAGGSGVVIIRYHLSASNPDRDGFVHYNTDVRDVEISTNSTRLWTTQDQIKNFGGHNLLTNSNLKGNDLGVEAIWTKTNNSTDVLAPDGSATTTKCVSGTSGNSFFWQTGSITYKTSTTYTESVWVRVASGTGSLLFNNGVNASQTINPTTTWQRFSFTYTTTGTAGPVYYLGFSTPSLSTTFYFWGWQLEESVTSPGPYTVTTTAPSPAPTSLAGYRTHAYTTIGTSSFVPATSGIVEVLVVAGGGGGGGYGGNDGSGGGGAGGLIYNAQYAVLANTTYTVTVGAGAPAQPTQGNRGFSGSNSQFGNLIAIGGGGGGSEGTTEARYGGPGGSGGGAGGYGFKVGGGFVTGQGNPGGACSSPGDGGGGGAGEIGYSGKTGNGGRGRYFPQFANWGYPAGWFAGGGGASGDKRNTFRTPNAAAGLGGLGGGGNGQAGDSTSLPALFNGVANTGGGGGASAGVTTSGGPGTTFPSGTGGSGIVLVRYRYD